jgi:hypothetical protein
MRELTREQMEQVRRAMHESVDQVFNLIEYDENDQAKTKYTFRMGACGYGGQMITGFEAVARIEFDSPRDFDRVIETLRQHVERLGAVAIDGLLRTPEPSEQGEADAQADDGS